MHATVKLPRFSVCYRVRVGRRALSGGLSSTRRETRTIWGDAWQKNETIPEQYWIDRKAFELIRLERLGLRQFYLGDLSNKEKHLMFLPEEFPIDSVAICLLGAKTSHKPTALLLFTARDTARFHNGQDTTFLKHIVDIVELHLGRWV